MISIGAMVTAIGLSIMMTAGICYLLFRKKYEKLLLHIEEMIRQGRNGHFNEKLYDESLLSAVENEMARYVAECTVSGERSREEKEKIKTLIADISHQTKTPIANVLLYAQLLEESVADGEVKEYAKTLVQHAEKLNFLITDLIKMSRMETGIIKLCPKKESVQRLIERVVTQIQLAAHQKDIKISVMKKEAEARFDLKWTVEALYNICDNAVKYSAPNSQIEILVSIYELFVRIDIRDQGIGIRSEDQEKVFQRFYRSYEVSQEEGVGIGLFLAREIIANEGGYIKLDSKIGKGSTFSVFLPK